MIHYNYVLGPFIYPIRRLIVKSDKVYELRYVYFQWSDR